MSSSMTRCEYDVSGPLRLTNHADGAEARLRQEMLRLVDEIKAVDGLWKGSNRVLVFLRSKRENKPTAHSGYAINLSEMSQRFVPEIQSMHRVDAIKRFIWIRNLIAARTLYVDQALGNRVAIVTLCHLHHFGRDVDAGYESFRCKLCHPRERPAMTKPHFKNSRRVLQFQQFEHALIYGSGLDCHYPSEQTPEKACRIARFPRDEFR